MLEKNQKLVRLALFASGAGSNAREIIKYFNTDKRGSTSVALIACNNPEAGVLAIAQAAGIETMLLEKKQYLSPEGYGNILLEKKIDWIILAGFLWKIPANILQHYPQKIINIHPSLLPKYGGKGMYGQRVHEAVIKNNEPQSGISIHFVDEIYDNGKIIFQAQCPVLPGDTPESLAEKIHGLEHRHFAPVIEQTILGG